MFPLGTSDSGQRPKVRRFVFIIAPRALPSRTVPDGAIFMESLVFALEPYPVDKVLSDYCNFNGLDSSKFVCHSVVFATGMRREGKGTISIQRDGNQFRGRINWRR